MRSTSMRLSAVAATRAVSSALRNVFRSTLLSTTALACFITRAETIRLAKAGRGGDLCSDCISSRDAKYSSRSNGHFVLL